MGRRVHCSVSLLVAVVLTLLSGISPATTTTARASTFIYDAPTISRVDLHQVNTVKVGTVHLTYARTESASPSSATPGASITPHARSVATESGPSFFRGAKPGEAPSFEPGPHDFKVDAATGTVKPTHGVSVFDNPGSVTSKGFVPHEVDLASVPPELQFIQRGVNTAHYEIVPQVGAGLTPEQYKGLMCQIACKS